MRKARLVKIGGTVVTIALLVLGTTLPSTPWIDQNRAIWTSIVAIIALLVGGSLYVVGIRVGKVETS